MNSVHSGLQEASTLLRSSQLFSDNSKTSLTSGSYADIQLTAGSHSTLFPVKLTTATTVTGNWSLSKRVEIRDTTFYHFLEVSYNLGFWRLAYL
jgi:hypothetical protein